MDQMGIGKDFVLPQESASEVSVIRNEALEFHSAGLLGTVHSPEEMADYFKRFNDFCVQSDEQPEVKLSVQSYLKYHGDKPGMPAYFFDAAVSIEPNRLFPKGETMTPNELRSIRDRFVSSKAFTAKTFSVHSK